MLQKDSMIIMNRSDRSCTSSTVNHIHVQRSNPVVYMMQGRWILVVTQDWKQTSGDPSGCRTNYYLIANNVNLL